MCHPVRCPACGRPTWAGCGAHVQQALRGVPLEKQCPFPRPKPLLEQLLAR